MDEHFCIHDGGRGLQPGELGGWLLAGMIALSAHVGIAASFMREQPIVPADNMPPAAIMIEFAQEAEAVNVEDTEISDQTADADAAKPVEEVETLAEEATEEPVPEEVALATPEIAEIIPEETAEEEIAEESEDPVEQELAMIPDAAVPLPVARPKPPEEKKPEVSKPVRREVTKKEPPKKQEVRKPVRQRQKPQAASSAAPKGQAQVQQSNRNASRQSSSGLFSSMTPARWQSRLMAHLERRKKYPADARRRGERGTVYVRFRIDDSGNVLSASLARSSGFPELDAEVLSLVRRASPVPTPPPGANRTITAPVKFSVR